MKKPPTLICGDDGPEVTTNKPEVTTSDPAATDCSCGKDIEKFYTQRWLMAQMKAYPMKN